jgi:hypothetical protein
MGLIANILFFLSLVIAGPAFAAQDYCDTLLQAIQQKKMVCAPGLCHLNSLNIVRYIQQEIPGMRLADARVLAIRDHRYSLFPQAVGREDAYWFFHFVVMYEGRVYDPEYVLAPKNPTVREYFNKQFIYTHWQDPKVLVIPAEDYLREYNSVVDGIEINSAYYLYSKTAAKRYPTVSAWKLSEGKAAID